MIPEAQSFFPPFDPETDDCPYEVYSLIEEMPLYNDDEDEEANTLKIRPYSINNYADYTNGVNANDLSAINSHINNVVLFESRTPTEDFPFRYISADADYDHDVDADDVDMLTDLLLGIRYDLERNSWEWVHKDEVEDAEERFEDEPWEFVIDYNWPGSEGIILPALTTNEIEADNDKFFTFRTTKIGDIIASGGSLNSGANTWVCGTGSYFHGEGLASRSISEYPPIKIRKGSAIFVSVWVDVAHEVTTWQIPVFIDPAYLDLKDVTLLQGVTGRWNFNPYLQSLVAIDYMRHSRPLDIQSGRLLDFEVVALHDIDDLSKVMHWSREREIEMADPDGNSASANVGLQIEKVMPPDFYIESRQGDRGSVLWIESKESQEVLIELSAMDGMHVGEVKAIVEQGGQIMDHAWVLPAGVYMVKATAASEISTCKMILH